MRARLAADLGSRCAIRRCSGFRSYAGQPVPLEPRTEIRAGSARTHWCRSTRPSTNATLSLYISRCGHTSNASSCKHTGYSRGYVGHHFAGGGWVGSRRMRKCNETSSNEDCRIHNRLPAAAGKNATQCRHPEPGDRRIEDRHHPRGYRELRSRS